MAISLQLAVSGLLVISMTSLWSPVLSHGRLWTPTGRPTMWRRGYGTPVDYNDNQLWCGGLQHQKEMGYKCGVCGDPWDSDRPNEAGGKFATGKITKVYRQGQKVVIQVQITANHKGWFEFKICPTNDYKVKATQECLNAYPLQLVKEKGTKLYVEKYGCSMVDIPVRLPRDLSCDFCVLQWHYHTGNSWGPRPDGKGGCIGCGEQEEFYGCADIKIEPFNNATANGANNNKQPYKPVEEKDELSTPAPGRPNTLSSIIIKSSIRKSIPPETSHPSRPVAVVTTQESASATAETDDVINTTNASPHVRAIPKVHPRSGKVSTSGDVKCHPVMSIPGLQQWCDVNCKAGYCPPAYCICERGIPPL